MNIAVTGALVGAGLAIGVLAIDYMMSKSNAAERARRWKKKPELDANEIKSLRSLASFCLFIPPAFALGAWMIWG
jgi:hypothetical protein